MSTLDEQPSMMEAAMRRWPIMVLVAILAAVAAGTAAHLSPKVWTGTASVVYVGSSSANLTGTSPNSDTIARTVASEALVAGSDRVLTQAAKDLSLTARQLKKSTKVTNPADSNILVFDVKASGAKLAANRAQGVANAYLDYNREKSRADLIDQADSLDATVKQLQDQLRTTQPIAIRSALQSSYAASLQKQAGLRAAAEAEQGPARSLSNGTPPLSPSSLGVKTSAALGGGLGLVIGFALVFFLVTAYPRRWARPKKPRTKRMKRGRRTPSDVRA